MHNFSDLRNTFPICDKVDGFYVVNVGGNKYRLITEIFFDDDTVLLRYVLTHKEYDKEKWKKR